MIKKIKQFFGNSTVKKILAFTGVISVMCCMGLACSAEEAASGESLVDGIKTVTTAVTGEFSIATIASILGIVLAACVGLFLFWWGCRKVIRMIKDAFTKGSLHP